MRYRVPSEDSLNSKLQPDPDYKTKAVLLTDDDVYYAPEDLEFVFQTWRKFGEFRLVGALPRCIDADPQGKYVYNQCKDMGRDYAMILTNLCFSHIGFLDYYWSDAPEMVKMRAYVDEHFNCEDIALNYVASALTGMGPLQANGYEHFHNLGLKAGISAKAGHLEARSQCLNDFQDIMGCQPLVGQSFYIVRGNGAGDRVHSGVWAYIGVLVCLAMRAMF